MNPAIKPSANNAMLDPLTLYVSQDLSLGQAELDAKK
jgi:hypothetical protein